MLRGRRLRSVRHHIKWPGCAEAWNALATFRGYRGAAIGLECAGEGIIRIMAGE